MSDQNQKTAQNIDELMVDETLIHDTSKQLTPELHCELFRHMLGQHGMVLLESELVAIVDVVRAEIAQEGLSGSAQAATAMQGRPTGFAKVDHSPEPAKRQCVCPVGDNDADVIAIELQQCIGFEPLLPTKACTHCFHSEACHQPVAPMVSRIGTEDDGEIV